MKPSQLHVFEHEYIKKLEWKHSLNVSFLPHANDS